MSELNPYLDWRTVAEMVKNYPRCAVCGREYGNASFGAEHYSSDLGIPGVCTGYVPEASGAGPSSARSVDAAPEESFLRRAEGPDEGSS